MASPSRSAFHDTWKVAIMSDGQQGAGRSETIEAIAGRLRTVLKVVQDLAELPDHGCVSEVARRLIPAAARPPR
ncbi:hypothetical protein [Bradyrhizobium sp. 145]|uniref:hypothetical protein n=1 Tax=unclassified Bradyrhizobium TaxID=2631580 RepID=UPI001FFBB60F|nr:hypothetical protein [Bradyrhizobium sp. 145]MCK1691056.1 hypothetical protein [Bradyrhizobium sp. 145]